MVATHGYSTHILSQRAVTFLERRHTQPFFLWLARKAVHPELVQRDDGSTDDPNGGKFIPADRHKSLYAGQKVQRRPNAMLAPKGKPALERKIDSLPPLGPATVTGDEIIRNRLRMGKRWTRVSAWQGESPLPPGYGRAEPGGHGQKPKEHREPRSVLAIVAASQHKQL